MLLIPAKLIYKKFFLKFGQKKGVKILFLVLFERVTKVNIIEISLEISTVSIHFEEKILSGATQPKTIKIGHVKENP